MSFTKNVSTFAIVLATFSSVAKADSFSGTYIGASLDHRNIKLKNTSFDSENGFETHQNHKSGNGGSLFMGYGKRFLSNNNLYLGLEYQIMINKSIDVGNYGSEDGSYDMAKMKPHFGLNGRVGYIIEDKVMSYLLLGTEMARYDVSPSQSGGDYTFAKKGSMFGLKYGLGVEVALTEKINARLEYYRVNYGSNGKGNLDAASGVYASEKFNFKNDTVRVGISYNIG